MKEKETNQNSPNNSSTPQPDQEEGDKSLVDELGVEDIDEPVFGARGRLFAAAGRNSPIAEFTDDFLILHPPQQPFEDENAESEVIVIKMDDKGVLINEIGERKKIPGARFHGKELYYFWEQKPGTMKHFAVFFDEEGNHHYLVSEGERLTTNVIYQLRNMTHDGELTKFPEIVAEKGS